MPHKLTTPLDPSLIICPEPTTPAIPLHWRLWQRANLLAGYCLLNLLDDPALLAMAFC
jgi:hypothetical protein